MMMMTTIIYIYIYECSDGDDGLVLYVLLNIIQVISRRWKDDNERFCAMKRREVVS